MTYKYLFSVIQEPLEDPTVDMFYEIPEDDLPGDLPFDQVITANALRPDDKQYGVETAQVIQQMLLRSRYATNMIPGIYLVTTEVPITREILNTVVQNKYHEGANVLKQWLDGARIIK